MRTLAILPLIALILSACNGSSRGRTPIKFGQENGGSQSLKPAVLKDKDRSCFDLKDLLTKKIASLKNKRIRLHVSDLRVLNTKVDTSILKSFENAHAQADFLLRSIKEQGERFYDMDYAQNVLNLIGITDIKQEKCENLTIAFNSTSEQIEASLKTYKIDNESSENRLVLVSSENNHSRLEFRLIATNRLIITELSLKKVNLTCEENPTQDILLTRIEKILEWDYNKHALEVSGLLAQTIRSQVDYVTDDFQALLSQTKVNDATRINIYSDSYERALEDVANVAKPKCSK